MFSWIRYFTRRIPVVNIGISAIIILIIFLCSNEPALDSRSANNALNNNAALDPKTIFRDGHLLNLEQNDPQLLEFIRENHLTPPSTQPYKLTSFPHEDPTAKYGAEWKIVHELLGNKRNGFFIECGANDGEFLSNSLVLERDFGWNGLLVEGDPVPLKLLLTKNRKAWISSTCLSSVPYPQEVTMQRHDSWNGMSIVTKETMKDYHPFVAKCVPLFSILSAIRIFEIDFFSLDVEMAELPILKTIPFDKLFIKVFAIEIADTLKKTVIPYVEEKGYVCLLHLHGPFVNDYIFIHKSLYKDTMKNTGAQKC